MGKRLQKTEDRAERANRFGNKPDVPSGTHPQKRVTLSRRVPDADESQRLEKECHTNDERSCVIIMSSQLERFLEWAIISKLARRDEHTIKELFEGIKSPLSTFDAKTKMAKALGIVSIKESIQLDAIRSIRNQFAHSWGVVKFADDEISKSLDKLPIAETPDTRNILTPLGAIYLGRTPDSLRFRFISACGGLLHALSLRILGRQT